jgi:uncharacterized protein YqjF (DUF2071 family)
VTTFLTAEWRKLIMANYAVEPEVLLPYLPVGTTLDPYEGQCYVSLVGFLFKDTRIKSVPVPFHRTFEEVNLRFYVQHTTPAGERRRGVVFLSELVPRFALTLVANTIYGEKYATVPLRYRWSEDDAERKVGYEWKHRGRWSSLSVKAAVEAEAIGVGSAEEFFTEHYWGYTARRGGWTSEYGVMHPRWEMYRVLGHSIEVDFGALYGEEFAGLAGREPESILLAEGSKIEVRSGARIGAKG